MSEIFDAKAFLQEKIKGIKRIIGPAKALVAVSGGVDSTTSAVLTHKAIGANLVCFFIDDNFMRIGETKRVKQILSSPPLSLPVKVLDEKKRFMGSLMGLKDAEEKRKAFRDTFYNVLSEAVRREKCKYLVQGTIKADVLETAQGVKTQHNVLEQIGINPLDRFGFEVVEPLVSLYKFQVREVSRLLGIPEEISERQPFPGPGLSIRVVGEINEEKLDEVKKATAIVEEDLKDVGADQYLAAILENDFKHKADQTVRTTIASIQGHRSLELRMQFLHQKGTGMAGKNRVYGNISVITPAEREGGVTEIEHDLLRRVQSTIQSHRPELTHSLFHIKSRESGNYLIALRAVKTRDFMTAEVAEVPWSVLLEVSDKILKACPKVAGVYFDITPKPPATIEYE